MEQLHHEMREALNRERLEHTLGVAYTAANLAFVHDADMDKALIAGMLHDCAKCVSDAQKLSLCRKYGLDVSPFEEEVPSLLHAKLGAYFAEHKYGVTDTEILDAIRSHTTGVPGMSLLQKIIFVADFIEPNRKKIPDMDEIRKEAYRDLDRSVLHILSASLAYLEEKNKVLDPMTKCSYDYYKEMMGE